MYGLTSQSTAQEEFLVPGFRFIDYRVAGGLATITIDRPPQNVLDVATMAEIAQAAGRVEEDRTAKALLITASGDKAFSAGVDVLDHVPEKVVGMLDTFHGLLRRLVSFPIPTIAALNGSALGGGCELAIACDMIVARDGTRIGQPEIRLGVFPPVAAILLPRIAPSCRARELLLGGGLVTASEALALGLVNRVFPQATFRADCQAFAEQFLSLSRVALLYSKRAIAEASGRSFADALPVLERIYLKELMATSDAVEGLNSFLEKRKPAWTNS